MTDASSLTPLDPDAAAPLGTQTLMRGLAVVQAVADGARDLKELCARIGVARSTTHRLASCWCRNAICGCCRAWAMRWGPS